MAHLIIIDRAPISVVQTDANAVVMGAGGSSNTYSVNFGTAASSRIIVGCFSTIILGTVAPSGNATATIAGIAAPNLVQSSTINGRVTAMFAAVVPTGTSGNIVVTLAGSDKFSTQAGIGVWAIYNGVSATPVETHADSFPVTGSSLNLSLTSSSAGAGIGFACIGSTGTSPSWAWTGLTENFDTGVVNAQISGADFVGQAPLSVLATPTNGGACVGVSALFQ